MSSSEFFEWMVMEMIEPFGDKRGDIQAGLIQMTLANIHRDPQSEPYALDIFLPRFVSDPEAVKTIKTQTPEEQVQMWEAIMALQNLKLPQA